MKQRIISLIAGLAAGLLVGCTTTTMASTDKAFGITKNQGTLMWSFGMGNRIYDVTDDETGIHYFAVYDEDSINALCPRYNSDGSLYGSR